MSPLLVFLLKLMPAIARNQRTDSIPTYRANGKRLSDSSLERAERLLALKLVVARRDRHGRIRNIQFKWENGHLDMLRKAAPVGTRYSYEQPLENGDGYVWAHRELQGMAPSDFAQVPLSCMGRAKLEGVRLAPVINIADYRRRQTTQVSGERLAA
ncbi:MAG TPA: hypothetical protein VFB14_13985 [Bryobacteraceae bacterium]|nr:hypothetical protein [Bryobacteraceae bacterium]